MLTFKEKRLLNTRNFGSYMYLGDPLNVARIFSDKKADEIFLMDIGVSAKGKHPDFDFVEKICRWCSMPVSYAGGVSSISHIGELLSVGVEKVCLGGSIIYDQTLLGDAVLVAGSQAISTVVNVSRESGEFFVYDPISMETTKFLLCDFLEQLLMFNIGEVVINDVDLDGAKTGIDPRLAEIAARLIGVPTVLVGGVGTIQHIADVHTRFPLMGVGVGTAFSFLNSRQSVLPRYVSDENRRLVDER